MNINLVKSGYMHIAVATCLMMGLSSDVFAVEASGCISQDGSNTFGNNNYRSLPSGRNGLFATEGVTGARAEKRCNGVQSGSLLWVRNFKVNGGANIGLAQFLNVKIPGETGGGSEPIAQLVADEQSNNSYRVSIEQGNQDCGFRIQKGEWYRLTASVDQGGIPRYNVSGNGLNEVCQLGIPERRAGIRGSVSGHYYFFKYGAYNVGSNNTAASSVTWASAEGGLRAQHSNKCVDVSQISIDNGANIHQWRCLGADNQQWKFEYSGSGYYRLRVKHSNKCLDVAGRSTSHGANIHQWQCTSTNNDNQRFKLDDLGDGRFGLRAKHSGKCVMVDGSSNDNGANVSQRRCGSGGNNKRFRLY